MVQEVDDPIKQLIRMVAAVQHDVEFIKSQFDLDDECAVWQIASAHDVARWNAEHLDDEEGRDLVG